MIYLFRLKDTLFKRLYTANLLEMFILKNLQVQNKDYAIDPRDRYKRTKGYHYLIPDEKNVFRKIYDVREKYAQMCNMPASNVIRNEDLIDIAKGLKNINEIRFSDRLSSDLIQRIMAELKNVGK